MIKEIRLPEISENVVSGDVIEVLVKVGDYIKQEQSIVELETEKATFEVPSPVGGQVTEINVKEGQKINVGQVILKVETEVQAPKTEKQDIRKPDIEDKVVQKAQIREVVEEPEQVEIIEGKPQPAAVSVSAAPSVRRLARELGIDINKVSGSGPGGRILLDDVKEYAKRVIIVGPTPSVTKQTQPLPDFTKWGDCQRQALTTTRKKIAETLSYTSANVPQATQYDQADITELEQFRAESAKKVEEAGGRLTITSILLK
ncbi:MAG: biotin/lipoyl-containing protein, partial [bacterium]